MSVTAPKGFVASGLAAGIKATGALDLALRGHRRRERRSRRRPPSPPTGPPPLRCRSAATTWRPAGAGPRAVVVSSGNANAATGARGRADAERMCSLVAAGLGVADDRILVCSDRPHRIPLPMAPIESGIPTLVAARSDSGRSGRRRGPGHPDHRLGPQGGPGRARRLRRGRHGQGRRPCWRRTWPPCWPFLTTDAAVEPGPLADLLRIAVRDSFNSMIGRRLHVDQRHRGPHGLGTRRAGRSQRGGRRGVRGLCLAVQPDDGRRRRGVQDLPGPGHRGPVRRGGPPGRPQGGRLAAGQVLAQRRGPLLGPGGQRAGLGRRRLRHGPPGRSPTAG